MRKAIKGKDFMIFVGGKAIALATSHSLHVAAETSDTSTKDSGKWNNSEITGMSWDASSENFAGAKAEQSVDISYKEVMKLFLAGEPVDIIAGIPKNITPDGVPEEGWTVPENQTGNQDHFKGKALITDVSMTAANKENATFTVTLTGVEKLEIVEPATA